MPTKKVKRRPRRDGGPPIDSWSEAGAGARSIELAKGRRRAKEMIHETVSRNRKKNNGL